MTRPVQPEFSRPFELADASERPRELAFAASAAEAANLAKRFDVIQLANVRATLVIAPHAQGYSVTGTVGADVTQACVVTDVPMEAHVVAPVNVLLWSGDIDGDFESLEDAYGVDDIDLVDSASYDVGEMSAQYLGLAFDPFPRAEGAAFDAKRPQEKANPFSVLAQLKDKA